MEESPHGGGTIVTIICVAGIARIATYGVSQLIVLEAPPALHAEILLWKATMPAAQ